MARYIIKDDAKYKEEQGLLNNRNFNEDMKIFLTFFVIVPVFALVGAYLSSTIDKNKSKKTEQELIKEKTEKAVNMKNIFNGTNLFKQR